MKHVSATVGDLVLSMTRVRRTVAVALLMLVVAAATLRVHIIWELDHGAQLLWSDSEAYLFIGHYRRGWSGTYVEFASYFIRSSLGGYIGQKNSRNSTTVFRISTADEKQYWADNISMNGFNAERDGLLQESRRPCYYSWF